ncbi:MAG: GNAT family N-acetyltransferase [Pseudomonadales bacterium]
MTGHTFDTLFSTERLSLRKLATTDAEFIVRLVNEPSWLDNIGDKKVSTIEDAEEYLLSGPMTMYETFGFGLYCVELRDSKLPIGMCGLIKRDGLNNVDIGFALLPEFCGVGYALEAAQATMHYGHKQLGIETLDAITLPTNSSSIRLLQKIGFVFQKAIFMPGDPEQLSLYCCSNISQVLTVNGS